jgi:CheY-like chemotaxis protein
MRILLVDDNQDYLILLNRFLELHIHAHITSVSSGPSALVMLRQHDPFDVIICDYEMPAMNGFELFEQMNDEEIKTPFLLYTNMELNRLPCFVGLNFLGVVRKSELDHLLGYLRRQLGHL